MHADAAPRSPVNGNKASSDDKLAYSVPNAAKVLDLSVRTVWQLVADGEIKSIKIRNARRIPRAALEEYVNNQPRAA